MTRPPLPGFHYAGLPPGIVAFGQSQPWSVRERQDHVILSGAVPLAKLHGSLNWAFEGDDQVTVFQDVRAAFRAGGMAGIVPPIPEKRPPAWLEPVWQAAADVLSDASVWVVVGYSLPAYDEAIRTLLRGSRAHLSTVELHDPCASDLSPRWRALLPDVEVVPLPGVA